MASGVDKFAKRRDRGTNGDSTELPHLSLADRQRIGQQLRFGSEAGSPDLVNMGTSGSEHHKDERPSGDIKAERDMWDTDLDSIGDTTTMTSKEREALEQGRGAHGEHRAEADDEATRRPLNMTAFLRDGESQGFEKSKDVLFKSLRTVSNGLPNKKDTGKVDYPSTSPSEAEFHQGLPLHGHRIQKDSERDQIPRREWENGHARPHDAKDPSKRMENADGNTAPPTYSMPPSKQPARADRSRPRPISRGNPAALAPPKDAAVSLPQRGVSRKAEQRDQARVEETPQPQKRPLDPEHTLEELRGMKFTDLKEEPFERGPKDPGVALPEKISSAPLQAKLDYLRALPEPQGETLESNLQYQFFSRLPIKEHEECGDLILGQFEAMLGRMRTIRQDKRKAALEFEGEIEERVNALQRRRDELDKNLATLKTKGEDVIRR